MSSLLADLHKEASVLLAQRGIYSVLDYAWQGEDEPSDEYLGLAIWSTDAPFKPTWFHWKRSVAPPDPSKRDEVYYAAGEDFIGTMEAARNAIGLALYSLANGKPDNILDDNEFFWEHWANAAILLNIAADRIREYFVMARFGQTREEYKAGEGKRNGFFKPFKAYEPTATPQAQQAANDLRRDAKELDTRREARNTVVHEVASRQGRNALRSLKHQKDASMQNPYVPPSSQDTSEIVKSWQEAGKAIAADRKRELDEAFSDLKAWYLLTVHAAALAFEYEYWKRVKK